MIESINLFNKQKNCLQCSYKQGGAHGVYTVSEHRQLKQGDGSSLHIIIATK